MDPILHLGPLAIATDRLIAVASIWLFVAVAGRVAARIDPRASRAGWWALAIGLLAARAGFVAQNFEAFRVAPSTILAVWQGGFSALAGIIVAALTLLVLLGRSRAGAIMLATLSVLSLVYLASLAWLAPEPRPLTPGLTVMQVDGTPVPIEGLRGRPFVVNLWATWCPPCRREMPMVVDVARSSAIPVLLVNQGESDVEVRDFLRRERLPADAVRLDPGSTFTQAAGSGAMPTTLFVDAQGLVRDIHVGEISRAALTDGIRKLERTRK